MRPHIPCLVGLAGLSLGLSLSSCAAHERERAPHFDTFRSYAADGSRMQSSLVQSVDERDAAEHLSGLTQLEDGSWVSEDAALDRSGRLLRAEAKLAGPCGHDHDNVRRIVLDARQGTVDITAPALQTRWSVPNDLPWVYEPLLHAFGDEQQPVATPVAAVIALRASQVDRAVRMLDVDRFRSHSMMVDQVVVPDEHETHVVLGDDVAEIDSSLPQRLHLAALGREVHAVDAERLAEVAAAPCAPSEDAKESKTL